MPIIQDLKIFPISNEDKFENFCLDLYKRKINDPNFQRNGRRGQRQNGVDIFGRRDGSFQWVGVQCKVKSTEETLTEKEAEEEIRKALTFDNPRLSEYIIVTTGPRDAKLQAFARKITMEHAKKGLFAVNIHFWDDIELDMAEENNLDILQKYYGDFFVETKKLGNSVGKLVCLEVGVENRNDSAYELMIGRIAKNNSDDFYGINYYRNTYYIVNLNGKTFDTFPIPCYSSDLEHVFRSTRDRHIISKWLSSIDMDMLLQEEEINYAQSISFNEFMQFLSDRNDA